MLDNILDILVRAARRCERVARKLDGEPLADMFRRLHKAIEEVAAASSGMFLGRHALVYIQEFEPKMPGEYYSNVEHRGPWAQYTEAAVQRELLRRAEAEDVSPINDAVDGCIAAFEQSKDEVLPAMDALMASHEDEVLRKARNEVADLTTHVSRQDFANTMFPRGPYITTWHDQAEGGIRPTLPPHLGLKAWVLERQSFAVNAKKLAKHIRYVANYLQLKRQMKGNTVARIDGKVFIGHGGSPVWRDLRDFLQERLQLDIDEFNQEPTAGLTTKERLEAMLDQASFAFLVMTAEDEMADGTKHARGNVIHELGLFQGRHGFERAIVLLEQECAEFTNIVGLTQIRFPKGNIRAVSEEIRRVLEREGII